MPDATTSSLAAQSPILEDVGIALVTVTVRDAAGRPVAGVPVEFFASGEGNFFGPGPERQRPTNGDGVAQWFFASSIPGTKIITAIAGGVLLLATAAVVVQAAFQSSGPLALRHMPRMTVMDFPRQRLPRLVPPVTPTLLLDEPFADGNLAARGWYDGNAPTMATVGGFPCIEAAFAQGAQFASWVAKRHLFTPTETLYVRYWVNYSASWVGSGQTFHPHEWEFLSDLDADFNAPATAFLGFYIEHNYQNGGIPRLAIQDSLNVNQSQGPLPNNLIGVTENRSVSGCNGVIEATSGTPSCFLLEPGVYFNAKEFDAAAVAFQPNPGAGYKNDWNEVQVYAQMNTISGGIAQADGVLQYWFNGDVRINRSDIVFRTGQHPTLKFKQVLLLPFMESPGAPVAQTAWFRDLIVMTARPAGGTASRLDITTEPTTGVEDTILSPAIQVAVLDDLGALVPGASNSIGLVVASGPGALTGTQPKSAAGGVASFTDIRLDTPGTYELRAAATGLLSAVTGPIVISGAGGGGDFPNEPVGAVVLMDYDTDFANLTNPPWDFQTGTGNLTTVFDATAPVNPNLVGRVTFNIGCCDGSGPAQLENFDRPAAGWDEWYISDWLKHDVNFNSNPADQKIFQLAYTSGGVDQFIRFCVPGLGSDTLLTPRISAATGGQGIQNYGGAQIWNLNQWYQAEFRWTRATGRVRLWIRPQGGAPQLVTDDLLSTYQVPDSGSEILIWWWGYGGSGAYPSGGGPGFLYHNHMRSSYVP